VRSARADHVRSWILAGLLALVAATNRWVSWGAGKKLVTGTDEGDYKTIALAAPHLPSGKLPDQHAQAFAPSYLVGVIAHALGVNVEYVFRAAVVLVILAICLCLHVALRRAGVTTAAYTLCMAVLIVNTYSFRYYLIVPAYIADIAFALAIALMLNALIAGRWVLALVAIAAAMWTRQSALPVGIALGWWLAYGAGFRTAPARVRVLRAAAGLLVPALAYIVILRVVAPFSIAATPGITGLTILGDLEHLGSSLGALAVHAVRTVNSLFAVLSLSAVALLAIRRAPRELKLPFEATGCFVVGCSIALQPFLLNTNYSGHPTRLAVLSLEAFAVTLAYLLRECERAGYAIPARTAAAIVAVLLVGSLQYLFTFVGPSTAAEGAVLQLVAAVVAGALLWRAFAERSSSTLLFEAPGLSPSASRAARDSRIGSGER
jgi:hypothetical protein